jgi:hypothetical protein
MVKLRRPKREEPDASTGRSTMVGEPAATGTAATDAPAPVEQAQAPEPAQQAAAYEPPPNDPGPGPGRGRSRAGSGPGGLLSRLDVGEQTSADRERQAALDWEQAMAPVMDLMRSAVPEASTPEEAERILSQNQGEITPDPEGGAYVRGDAFDTDARVYYRLLRRGYEKNPRPSQKREVSHHLHGAYGKLTGTKGW